MSSRGRGCRGRFAAGTACLRARARRPGGDAAPRGLPPGRARHATRPESTQCLPIPPGSGKVPAPIRVPSGFSRVLAVELGQGWTAWRAEGVPLMIVKKVLTPYGRLLAAKLLAALCRVGPIEACPDGAGDVVASDTPVGSESTDDV